MKNSGTARIFLGLNAAFSLITGANLLFLPGFAAEILFLDTAGWQNLSLRILGAGLIVFALDLTLMATDRFVAKGQVLLITAMDTGWVLASILLLAFGSQLFSGTGQAVIVAVAVFVAVFAIGQYLGARDIVVPLSQATVKSSGDKLLAKVSRTVDAPRNVVWKVMTDHPRYADVADNISKVEVVAGNGEGMQRRCYGPKGESWLETCDLFDEGHAFGFRIPTEADDYPYPISKLHGAWSVVPQENGSTFTIDIEATPKDNLLMRTLFKTAAKRQFKAVLADLADAWADRMEREARA